MRRVPHNRKPATQLIELTYEVVDQLCPLHTDERPTHPLARRHFADGTDYLVTSRATDGAASGILGSAAQPRPRDCRR
jgi:hypothetical protein